MHFMKMNVYLNSMHRSQFGTSPSFQHKVGHFADEQANQLKTGDQ
ncbi:hypothetical protein [Methylomonas fluvii]|nr:hypothetical protein [Methylomonas fluvii]